MNRVFHLATVLAIAAPTIATLSRPALANPSLCQASGGGVVPNCSFAAGLADGIPSGDGGSLLTAAAGGPGFAHSRTAGMAVSAKNDPLLTVSPARGIGIRHVPSGSVASGVKIRRGLPGRLIDRPARGFPLRIARAVAAARASDNVPRVGFGHDDGLAAIAALSVAAATPIAALCNAVGNNPVQDCGFDYGPINEAWNGNTGTAFALPGNPAFAYYGTTLVVGGALGANNRLSQTQATVAETTDDSGAQPAAGDGQVTGSPRRAGEAPTAVGADSGSAAIDSPGAGGSGGIDNVSGASDVPAAAITPAAAIVPVVSTAPVLSSASVAAIVPIAATLPVATLPVATLPVVAPVSDLAPVPEPTSLVLFGTALVGLFGLLRRHKRGM